MRKVDGGGRLPKHPSVSQLISRPDSVLSKCRRLLHPNGTLQGRGWRTIVELQCRQTSLRHERSQLSKRKDIIAKWRGRDRGRHNLSAAPHRRQRPAVTRTWFVRLLRFAHLALHDRSFWCIARR